MTVRRPGISAVLSRVLNLPFRVLGKAARAVQQAEAARQAARGDVPSAQSSAGTLDRSPLDVPPEVAATTGSLPVAAVLAAQQRGDPLCFVDVRSPEEQARGHIPGSLSMPDETVLIDLAEIPPATRILVVGDRAGRHARRVASFLRYRGLEDCFVLEGGYAAWKGSGGPAQPG